MIDNEKEFNDTVEMFEPMPDMEMNKDDVDNMRTNAIVSIAISLKRIADVICREKSIAHTSGSLHS
jgi:hypothetical protein